MLLETALSYAAKGYYVLPVESCGKRPIGRLVPNAAHNATTDQETIKKWWSAVPDANIGIAALNCLILDLDINDNGSGIDEYNDYKQIYDIPDAPMARTGSGGLHLYFKRPAGRKVSAQTHIEINGEKTNIDIRVGFSYVVAPPSVHSSGNNYDWETDLPPVYDLPVLPDSFLDAIGAKRDTSLAMAREVSDDPISILKEEVRGREVDILRDVAGIPSDVLDGKHHPCPKCGGKDRFRMIDAESGAVYCNQCFRTGNGDFISAIRWMTGCTTSEAMDRVCDQYHLPKKTISSIDLSALLDGPRTDALPEVPIEDEFDVQVCDPSLARPIKWAWKNHLPKGKLTIIAGRGSAGKSSFVTALTSIMSAGRQWPDGTPAERGVILYFYSEDDFRDTLTPRFCAAECDPQNVRFIQFTKNQTDAGVQYKRFCLAEVSKLARLVKHINSKGPPVTAIVFDPITGFLGSGVDTNKNSIVREMLTHLSNFGEQFPDVSLIAIAHTKKGTSLGDTASDTISGAGEFTNVARCVWNVYEDRENECRIAAVSKWNIGEKPMSIRFQIVSKPFRYPDGRVDDFGVAEIFDVNYEETADEYLDRTRRAKLGLPAVEEKPKSAKEWLKRLLESNGAMVLGSTKYAPSKGTIMHEASKAGIGKTQVYDAIKTLGCDKSKDQNGKTMIMLSTQDGHEGSQEDDMFSSFAQYSEHNSGPVSGSL